jgi:glucans biosynthesis protein
MMITASCGSGGIDGSGPGRGGLPPTTSPLPPPPTKSSPCMRSAPGRRPITFDPTLFDVPPSVAQAVAGAGGLNGFSGFRLLGPINRSDVWDEIGAFQGSSYFRSLGRDQAYGLSARGLAIGAGDHREEFPDFVAWWLERPAPDAASLVIHGLLDSPSCTGAYRFQVTPGDSTVIEISATIFPRRMIEKAGVAPASSMFLFDVSDPQNLRGRLNDYRSGVHDSDGLSIWTGDGRRLWRPLNNPRSLRLSTFPDTDPKGFGLVQRKRDFESYGDLEAHYHRRPSMWVEPLIPFGAGEVCLLELATQMETDDNIACFWRPSAPWQAGQEIGLHYRLYFGTEPHPAPLARVVRTRSGRNSDQALFAVDFQSGALDPQTMQVSAAASAGAVAWSNVIAHADPGVVRATFGLQPQGPADLSLTLLEPGGAAVSETWVNRFDG